MTKHRESPGGSNNSLVEALDSIALIPIPPLADGYSETIGDFYDDIIEPLLPG